MIGRSIFWEKEFGQKDIVISSNTTVVARALLVDVDTGTKLWDGRVKLVESSNSGGGGGVAGLVAAAVIAAVEQVADSVTDRLHDVARAANHNLIYQKDRGMLVGPLHPEFGKTDED